MATCYICGKSNAEYRRNVQTGTSNRVYYGKRGISTSTSTSRGLRTVCANCALNIDYNSRKQSSGFVCFLSLGILCGIGLILGLIFSLSKAFLIITAFCTVAFIPLSIICKKNTEKEAYAWYVANKGKYINSAEVGLLSSVSQKFAKTLQSNLEKFQNGLNMNKSAVEKCLATSTSIKEAQTMVLNCDETINQIDMFIKEIESKTADFCSDLIKSFSRSNALDEAINDCECLMVQVKNSMKNEKNEFLKLKEKFTLYSGQANNNKDKNICENIPLGYRTADVFDQNYWNETFWRNVTIEQVNQSSSSKANYTNTDGANALFIAALYVKNPKVIQALIDKGCDVNAETKSGLSIPMTLLKENSFDAEILRTILESGFNINNISDCGETLLTYALYNCPTFEAIKILFEYGADVNEKNKDGQSPVNIAAGNKNVSIDVIMLMLNMGLKIREINGKQNALSIASMLPDNAEKITALIDAGYHLETSVDDLNNTALCFACTIKNNQNNILTLLDKGADLEHRNNRKQTPLSIAINSKNKENAEILIKKGADINVIDEQKKTPLLIAAETGDIDTTKLLISKGVNVNYTAFNLETALSKSVQSNKANELLDLLANAGANLNYEKEDGNTLLIDAVTYDKDASYIETVLKSGAEINHVANNGKSALAVALESESHPEVIELLLKAGADKNMKDKDGKTMMQLALKNKNSEIVKYFMNIK